MGRTKKHKASARRILPALPLDVIENILTWLPTKPAVRFRCLNKHFLAVLISSVFAEKHFSRSPRDVNKCSVILQAVCPNEFYYVPDGVFRKVIKLCTSDIGDYAYIVGCSNGLICLSHRRVKKDEDMGITLWNPAIKECRKLPHPFMKKRPRRFVALGFGFHPTINEYKVVKLVPAGDWEGPYYIEVEVYSLSTNSWRQIGDFPYSISDKLARAVVNGVVHWIASHGNLLKYNLILGFDMADEVFKELAMPKVIDPYHGIDFYLRTFQGCLSILVVKQRVYINIWVMKEYGVRESWTKLFSLQHDPIIHRPIDFIKDDDILLQKSPWDGLLSFNLTTEKTIFLGVPGVEKHLDMDAIPYLESLVQLSTNTQAAEDQQPNVMEI